MENLIVAILLYVAIVAIAHCPKSVAKTDTVNPTAPIDYFPDPMEETTEPETKAIAAPAPVSVANDLSALPIRTLYAMAKGKVKGYKKLSKAQLIENLGGLGTATMATA